MGVDRAAGDVPDSWDFGGSYPCLYRGGSYGQVLDRGPFCVFYIGASYTNVCVGCRILDKP